jgi:hypothetical protein
MRVEADQQRRQAEALGEDRSFSTPFWSESTTVSAGRRAGARRAAATVS